MKKKRKLEKLFPPNVKHSQETTAVVLCEILLVLYAASRFSHQYGDAVSKLYDWAGGIRALIRGAVLPQFSVLTVGCFRMLPLALVVSAGLVLWNYLSYRQGSMSVYLMRRLPDRSLIHRQCLTFPVLSAVLYVLTALLLLGIFALVYRYATPAGCLP